MLRFVPPGWVGPGVEGVGLGVGVVGAGVVGVPVGVGVGVCGEQLPFDT